MATTIQDVAKAAADLGAAIGTFSDADTKATGDQQAADAAQAVATQSAGAEAKAKQSMLDAHETFDRILDLFLHNAT